MSWMTWRAISAGPYRDSVAVDDHHPDEVTLRERHYFVPALALDPVVSAPHAAAEAVAPGHAGLLVRRPPRGARAQTLAVQRAPEGVARGGVAPRGAGARPAGAYTRSLHSST